MANVWLAVSETLTSTWREFADTITAMGETLGSGFESEKDMDAYDKALELLRSSLNDKQRYQYDSNERFIVQTPEGAKYMITESRNYGVIRLIECGGHFIIAAALCAFPGVVEDMPLYDGLYQIKLMLEARGGGEDRFLEHANIQLGDRPTCHASCEKEFSDFISKWQGLKKTGIDEMFLHL